MPSETEQNERILFERFKEDSETITQIYQQYADRMYGFVLKHCMHPQIAEDIVGTCFVRLLESRDRLEWHGVPIGAWLYRVALNLLNDHWRKDKKLSEQPLDTDKWDPPSLEDPEWQAELVIKRTQLADALAYLSKRDQEVLVLRFYGGYGIEEVANELGISKNHASVLVYRALGRMRKQLCEKKNV